MNHFANLENDFKSALFKSDTVYDPGKNVWVKTITVAGKERKLFFAQKPVWLQTLEDCNRILAGHPNPFTLRKLHDEIWALAVKSDNAVLLRFDKMPLTEYLKHHQDSRTLSDLKQIFTLKLRDEEKSCVTSGSLPSSSCSTMRRLSNIVSALSERISELPEKSIPQNTAGIRTFHFPGRFTPPLKQQTGKEKSVEKALV